MKAFLYINLTNANSYQQPLLDQAASTFPDVALLDLDARSGELIQHYALQLMREATRQVITIKTDESVTDLGALLSLLEELFTLKPERLILLQGNNARLQRMFKARESIKFNKASEDIEVIRLAQGFLNHT